MARFILEFIFAIVFCSLTIEASVQVIDQKWDYIEGMNDGSCYRDDCFKNGRYFFYTHREWTPTEKNVTVHLVKNPLTQETNSCNITAKTHYKNTEIADEGNERLQVVYLGGDRGLILWYEVDPKCMDNLEKCSQSEMKIVFNLLTIHFPTCTIAETMINCSDSIPLTYREKDYIVPFDDHFDTYYGLVFFNGTESEDWLYRMSIDYNGTIIGKQTPQINSSDGYRLSRIWPVDKHSPEKGYIYEKIRSHQPSTMYTLIKPDGTEKLLLLNNSTDLYFSISNETIGICYTSGSMLRLTLTLHCYVYDLDGNLKWASGTNYRRSYPRTLLSLSGGGLFILNDVYANCNGDGVHCEETDEYSVRKIDSMGKDAGEFRLQGVIRRKYSASRGSLWQNESGEGYCATFEDSSYNEAPRVYGNCFTDSDFSSDATVYKHYHW